MNLRSSLPIIAAALSVALALAGCGSDDSPLLAGYSCSTKGPCPKDAVPSAEETMACETLSADATCGVVFSAYAQCAYSAKSCSATGVSDAEADSVAPACTSAYAKYTTCIQNKVNDPGAAGATGAADAAGAGGSQ